MRGYEHICPAPAAPADIPPYGPPMASSNLAAAYGLEQQPGGGGGRIHPAGSAMTAANLTTHAATLPSRAPGPTCSMPGCSRPTLGDQPGQICSKCSASPATASSTLGRGELAARTIGGFAPAGRSAFVGSAPNLAERGPSERMPAFGTASNSPTISERGPGGRISLLPQVEQVFAPEMATGARAPNLVPSPDSQPGARIPRTEQLSAAPIGKPKARCQKCSVGDNLRRVRCCSVHYCVNCLKDLISAACTQSGGQLTCLACRSPWDLQKLAAACNLELPASVLAGQRKPLGAAPPAAGGAISEGAPQVRPNVMREGANIRGTTSPSHSTPAAATLPHRANPGYAQHQHQTLGW